MAELVTLTVPVQLTTYAVNELHLNWGAQRIEIGLVGSNGEQLHHAYGSTTATAFMVALNKANLSSTSLHKRVMQRLIADGVVAGTISGSPD